MAKSREERGRIKRLGEGIDNRMGIGRFVRGGRLRMGVKRKCFGFSCWIRFFGVKGDLPLPFVILLRFE